MLKLLKPKYISSIYNLNEGNHLLSDGTIVNLTETDIDQINFFVHYLLVKHYQANYCFTREYIEIHSNTIHHRIFNSKNSEKILDLLRDKNIIIVNDSYTVNKVCKGYRLNFYSKDIEVISYDYKFLYKNNLVKFEELFKNVYSIQLIDSFENKNRELQLKFISKLQIDFNLLESTFKFLIKNKKKLKKNGECNIFYLNHLRYVEYECYSFQQLKHFNLYDSFSGRFYNFFTNKPSKIRECFFCNNKILSSIDIKSSQIYFFTQLPNFDLSNFKIDRSKIIIDDDFKNEVLNGDIYSFFANKLGVDRDKAKVQLLSYFYGDKRIKRLPNILSKYFPNTYNTIQYLKQFTVPDERYCYTIIVNNKTVVKNNYLNYILQSVERNIFLKSMEGLIDYFTVHDSLYFEMGRELTFKRTIENYLISIGLDLPKFSIQWNGYPISILKDSDYITS